ncbi:MAG: UDP-N-acetylglucosamine 1-carboxyvinyltransferase [Enterocloster sp.]
MSVIQVFGLTSLKGEISIQGSKNAVLPMMAAALLHKGVTVLTNVPDLLDVSSMVDILESLGCRCLRRGDCMVIDARNIDGTEIPRKYVSAMRSSIIVLGALLGRMGEGSSCYPGGCLIGARPIDLHLMALKELGAEIHEEDGWLRVRCGDGRSLKGAEIHLSYPSVGATEQAVLASVLARDVTVIHGAAMEPEIEQLCRFLNNMGAVICGMGTDHLMVQGVTELHDSCFQVEGDRIVAGTYGAAAAAAGGRVLLRGVRPSLLKLPLAMLEQAGAAVRTEEQSCRIEISVSERPKALDIKTGPYPAFPTDLQSPFMAFLSVGQGVSRIEERVFEKRFATAEALKKMGALIEQKDRTALIRGSWPLKGAEVEASDLRGGAALAVAALAAEGETRISRCRYVSRGYEDICRDLSALGAHIRWLSPKEAES